MNRDHRAQSGFTLIELMLVLAIIAIVAAMAFAEVSAGAPRQHILADAGEVRTEMIKARTRAVRDGKLIKVCVFRATNANSTTNGARYFMFECDDRGNSGCAARTVVCSASNFADSAGPFFTAASVTVPPVACTVGDGKWCQLDDIDLTTKNHAVDDVSINTFYDASRTALGPAISSMELTYSPNGTLIGSPYSSVQAGFLDFTSVDACQPSRTACTTFINRVYLKFSLGGSVQVVE